MLLESVALPLVAPVELDSSLVLGALELVPPLELPSLALLAVPGVAGELLLSIELPLEDCAHAALASNAAATAAAICFSVMTVS
jgi:hypothetical protein